MKVRDSNEFARKYLVKHLKDQVEILGKIKKEKGKKSDFFLWKKYLLLITNANYVLWLDRAIAAKYLTPKDVETSETIGYQAGLAKNCLFEANSILEFILE